MKLFTTPHKDSNIYTILGYLGGLFYVLFAIYDGPRLFDDSYGYINMSLAREPIYSIFLYVIRNIFILPKSDSYLYIVIILQGILAAYTTYSLTRYLSIEFKLSHISTTIVYMFPILVSILFRFIAGDRFFYSNTILTEGITISLHLLFIRWCLEYLLYQSKKSFWILCILCFIGFNTRKQLLIWTALFILAILWTKFKKKRYIYGISLSSILTFFLLGSSLLFDCSYNYFVNGQFIRHVNDNRFIATMIFYTANETDSNYIENDELKTLYIKIYDECNANQHLLINADKNLGWFDREIHLIENYDQIQLRIMLPMIQNELNTIKYADNYPTNERVDQIVQYYNKTLLPHKITDIIPVFIDNFFTGLATTVSQRNRILVYWAWFVYIIYIILLIGVIRKKNKTKVCNNIITFSIFVLINILANVSIVSAAVFCQTRYTIYNMPLLYIACFLLLQEFLRKCR